MAASDSIASLNRREFMRRAAVSAAALPAVSLLLAACGGTAAAPASGAAPATGGSAKAAGSAAGSGKLQLPTYVPFNGPKPDFPALPNGTPAGFINYPKNPVKSVAKAPGSGGTIDTFVSTYLTAPTPLDKNAAWQELNKQLNVTLNIPIINVADYQAKLNTEVAGGSLPDAISPVGLPNLPDFLQSACEDLTPFLAGDAVKDYPNLANFTQDTWRSGSIYNNRIYLVPSPSSIGGTAFHIRQSLLDQMHVPADETGIQGLKTLDDYTRFAKQVTIPGQRYTFASNSGYDAPTGGWTMTYFMECFGVPNQWRNDNGKLTRDIETDEFKAALAYFRGLWDQGLISPDAPSLSVNQSATAWYSDKTAMWLNGIVVFPLVWHHATSADPTTKVRLLGPLSPDGKSKPVQFLSGAGVGATALKKASPDRIKEILRVLDFLAAPFGSTEYLLVKYGVQGTDYTLDPNGNPVPTKQGNDDLTAPWFSLTQGPPVVYDSSISEIAPVLYNAEKAFIAIGIQNPVQGLYSPSNAAQSPILNQLVTDGLSPIMYGRAPLSGLDDVIKSWRSKGGDKVRAEFEQALQDSTK